VTAVTQLAITVTDGSRHPVYKRYEHHAETIVGGRESTASSQLFGTSGVISLGAGPGERSVRDVAEEQEIGHQATPASGYIATMLRLTDDAVSGITIRQLARRVLKASTTVLRADAGRVVEVDSEGRIVRVLASRGVPLGISTSTEDGTVAVRLVESGAPMLAVSDYATDECAPALARNGVGMRSGVTALIRGATAPYGLVSLYAREPRSWSAEETDFLQLAANILRVAVATKLAADDRRVLLCRLVRAQEEERQRIAVEIHDDAVQVMTAINLQLAPLIDHLEGQRYRREGRQVQKTVRLTIGRLRRLLFQLTPPELQRHGLASSLRLLLETLQEDSGVRWELDNRLIEEPAPAAAVVVYRIVQEALGNVRKHAGASSVRLRIAPGKGGVDVLIEDNGCGLAPEAHNERGHLGVVGMGARAEMSGGRLRIRSVPGRGTVIEFWIPIPGASDLSDVTALIDAIPAPTWGET
jgi:signal transduction histidine kinase